MSDIELYSQAGPSHQRRASEIIDVDALPDEIAAGPSSSTATRRSQSVSLSNSPPVHGRPPARRQRVVYVIDSDDDEAAPRPLSGASRRRLFSPPAPAAQHHTIPPVPALPRRYSRHPSHANQPPVIIPNHAPFAFEVQLDQRPPSPQPPVLPPRGAPRSHHQPALGLGGALLALNRRETENRQRAQEAQQGRQFRPFGVIADTIMHYFGARPEPPPGHVPYLDFADFMEADWGDDPWDGEWLPEGHRHNGNFGFPKTAPKPPAWIPSYTHPGEPQPGFTFHFESKPAKTPPATVLVIHDDGHVTESANSPPAPEQQPTLVCARCLDPLVMSGQGGPELSGEEAKKLRVWALRCGHMLDGKCIGELMRPEYIIQDKTVPEIAGKTLKRSYSSGKSRIVAVPADRKGKRKAIERDPSMGDLGLDLLMTDDTSMRSRLRPRGNRSLASVAMNDVSMASVASTPAQPVPPATRSTRPVRPLPRRGTTGASSSVQMETSNANLSKPKAKGKGRARKPVVEARHEWFCPVAGCCKEHGSVRMRGEEEWKMDDAIGAIALYV